MISDRSNSRAQGERALEYFVALGSRHEPLFVTSAQDIGQEQYCVPAMSLLPISCCDCCLVAKLQQHGLTAIR